jgi:hypothetical protein
VDFVIRLDIRHIAASGKVVEEIRCRFRTRSNPAKLRPACRHRRVGVDLVLDLAKRRRRLRAVEFHEHLAGRGPCALDELGATTAARVL